MRNKVKKLSSPSELEEGTIALNGFEHIDYFDSFVVEISSHPDFTVDEAVTSVFSLPEWVTSLLKLRNIIVKPFGLETDGKTSKPDAYYSIGSKAIYFTVINRNDSEIVMAEDDKHLNFRTSVLVYKNAAETNIQLTTIVHYNNSLGKVYFFFVKPFHRLIMRSLLSQI
jgi:hypothetical protein